MSRDDIIYSDHQTDTRKDTRTMMDMGWEDAKAHIRPFLAPARWERLVDKIPQLAYSRFLDLSIYYYTRSMSDDGKELRISWIDHRTLTGWGITVQTLKDQAIRNLGADGYSIQCIDGLINSSLGGQTAPHDIGISHLYVLTNKEMFWGASGILDRGIIRAFAEDIGHSLYIIPSSVHEVLLCPDLGQIDEGRIDQIIKEVNATQVAPRDRLSDHAYHYDKATDEIRERRWETVL